MSWRPRAGVDVPSGTRRLRLAYLVPLSGAFIVLLALVVVVSTPKGRPPPSGALAVVGPTTVAVSDQAATTVPGRSLPPLVPTAATPLRVLEIGDSLGIDLGDQLQTQLDATGLALTTVAALGDTGLSNTSYYDWPAHLVTLLVTDHPQVLVVFLGANDDQGLQVDGAAAAPGTAAWIAAYAQRVDAVLGEATDAGARVVWVGMPPMADSDLNAAMQLEDMIYRREVATVPGALYVPSAPVLGNGSGLYQTIGVDLSGEPVALRTPDGVHLTPAGAGLLARTVIEAVDTRWHLSLEAPSRPPIPDQAVPG
jgi:hypothetical protein